MNILETGINPKTAEECRRKYLARDGSKFVVFRVHLGAIDRLQAPRAFRMLAGEHRGPLLALRRTGRQALQLAHGLPAVGRAEGHGTLHVPNLAPGRKIDALVYL